MINYYFTIPNITSARNLKYKQHEHKDLVRSWKRDLTGNTKGVKNKQTDYSKKEKK